ncbi:hypothetical protein NPA09_02360 [Mycoplasmopsis equigenitalium]|uniref:Spermidine/putrescine ABC transporter substrate-binding protein n=1 Tax=Mycoplasmopsis equigenitalium TaxID=114883 RepID=A0ABY5J3K3_9BACT|nr:hypothetical protein [Mycoplasmopsis equigenitalium]UUD36727.1 hypothetical protein NPA09_02360 [Mycoplasmopsis equigenitalium]
MKTKKLKFLGYLLLFVAFFASFITVIALKISKPYKPSFYNYASYISIENRKKIEKTFDYKEFQVLEEFNDALTREKAIAGIGTDNQVVTLIKQDRLRKIDYQTLFGVDSPKEFLTEKIWKQMETFDQFLTTDANGKLFDKPRHLWEYFIPYYAQDFVIAYNHTKNNNKHIVRYENDSYFEILNKLKEQDYKKLFILDDFRNMLAMGTSRMLQEDGTYLNKFDEINGNVTEKDYKIQLQSFVNLIEDSLQTNIKDNKKIVFSGDGQEVLRSLIDPNSNVDMAILFNGDALDAYYSEDNFESVPSGSITIVKPINNIITIDGIVLNKNISDAAYERYIKTFEDCFIGGYKDHTKFDNFGKYDQAPSLKSLENAVMVDEEIDYEALPFLSNFDLINYTPVYKLEYDFHKMYYFDDDEEAIKIYELNKPSYISIRPISKKLHSIIVTEYNSIIKG